MSQSAFLIHHKDYKFREKIAYPNGGCSFFYDNGEDMVIVDDGICDHKDKEAVFSYMLITDKQNNYMHRFGCVV